MRYTVTMQIKLAKIGALVLLSVFGVSGCAQTGGSWPAYRGEYYAFDAYPHGYKGYPAYPYYGAPFGYGGPAFAATQPSVTVSEQTTTRERVLTHRRHARRHHRRSAAR